MNNTIMEDAYPSSFDFSEFENIQTYKGRLAYARKHLKAIKRGSSRMVFEIDESKVLKIALNTKGLAQNGAECDWTKSNYDILAKVFESGPTIDQLGPFWLEMEKAYQPDKETFEKLTGFPFDDMDKIIQYYHFINRGINTAYTNNPINKARYERAIKNEFISDLMEYLMSYGLDYTDILTMSTYGIVYRDGKPRIVLIDHGINPQIWDEFYTKKKYNPVILRKHYRPR